MSAAFVVGVDGSPDATAALRWATEEAALHGASVTAVLAWTLLDQHHAGDEGFEPGYGEAEARRALRAYVDAAVGEGEVAEVVVCDLPADGLLGAAAGADLLVAGRRGHGGFPGLRLGSVGDKLLGRSRSPLALVGTAAVPGRHVVVGVDGSATSQAALRWAAREAAARSTELVVVHTWSRPWLAEWAFEEHAPLFAALRGEADEVVERMLADAAGDLAGVEVRAQVGEGGAARRLLEAAATAGVVVIGSRGLGSVAGAVFGSVSRQVVHHAPCPVVVVPPEA